MALAKLTTKQNNTLSFTITVTDSAGTAVNLTGATVVVKVYNGNTVIETETITTHTSPSTGVTTCTFTNTETAAWPVILLGYEVQATLASGSVYSDDGILECIKDR